MEEENEGHEWLEKNSLSPYQTVRGEIYRYNGKRDHYIDSHDAHNWHQDRQMQHIEVQAYCACGNGVTHNKDNQIHKDSRIEVEWSAPDYKK